MKKVFEKVLERITPTKKELNEEKQLVEEIRKKLKNINGTHSHLEWCGSSARGTHLHGDRDLDLFLMFDKKLTEKQLEKEGLRIAKKIFKGHKWELAYSQHPYVRGVINSFDVEIVPSYIVKKGCEKKSAVDRTPFHNKYLLKRFNAKQKQEVRLLKQFFKGIGAYGADLKNNSLPGYGIELLVLKYGTFEKAIKGISKWKKGEIIEFGNIEKSVKKFEEPLVLIDPVDENRNVASALNEEQFNRIIFASQLFLKKPSEKFFFHEKKKIWEKERVKKMLSKKELLAIKGDFPQKVLSDLMWGQLKRFEKKIGTHLKENDFVVTRTKLWSNEKEVFFIIELENIILQKSKKIIGPKTGDVENVKRFLGKKRKILSGPRVEKGRIVLEVERKQTSAIKVLEEFLKENKKTEKDDLKLMLKKGKVLGEKELLEEHKGDFAEFFSLYLEGKEVFE